MVKRATKRRKNKPARVKNCLASKLNLKKAKRALRSKNGLIDKALKFLGL